MYNMAQKEKHRKKGRRIRPNGKKATLKTLKTEQKRKMQTKTTANN